MSKVSGSYQTLSRGVSQQVPELRLDGQHSEQVNMITDPVQGLARRRGSRMQTESRMITGAVVTATNTDAAQFTRHPFSVGLGDFTMLYRKGAKPSGSQMPDLMVYNKIAKASVPVITDPLDTNVVAMFANGVSAVTQVGRFLVMASRGWLCTASTADRYDITSNARYAAVWVRQGVYSRKYTVTVSRVGQPDVTVTHTTVSASYPGTLTTADIPASDPEYQKKVNDRVNAYNSAVTQWLGTANAAIQPPQIAADIAALLVTAGIPATVVGAHIVIDEDSPLLTNVRVDDNGDNTLMRSVHQTIESADRVTTVHRAGKIVKVQAKDNDPAYYLEAVPENPGATGWTKVTWREAAAESFTPGVWFMMGTVDAGNFYVASTPALLRGLVPALTLPDFSGRDVGDPDTNKAPYFVSRQIDYLGSFQDRLVVGSGGVLQTSEVGNYFNFFRTSVLTVVDKDPVELYALGGEDDTVRHSVIFDKSLLLFGEEQQYSISGRVPLTPATSSVIQSSAHEGATDAKPVSSGELVFYTKQREGYTQAHQIQVGQVEDTSNSTEITQQLSTYIPGTPVEINGCTSPDTLFLRTDASPYSVYVYRYLDQAGGQQRILDSWSRWDYNPACGRLLGAEVYKGQVLLHWLRPGTDLDDIAGAWYVVDNQSLLPNLDSTPYLDSQRPYVSITDQPDDVWHSGTAGLATAFDNRSTAYLQGAHELSDVPDLIAEFPAADTDGLITGLPYDSYVDPTNPVVRDRNGVAISAGRLTVTNFTLSYTQTGAIRVTVTTEYSTDVVLDFNGRVLGSGTNLVGIQPVSKGSTPAFVGRERREFTMRISSKDWLPLNLTAFEWTGQFFYHPKRV